MRGSNPKWSRDYAGFESILDFDIEDALEAIVPNNEWTGTIRITFEYIEEEPYRDAPQSTQDWELGEYWGAVHGSD